jgi:hypothetical protein
MANYRELANALRALSMDEETIATPDIQTPRIKAIRAKQHAANFFFINKSLNYSLWA